ncbi:cell division protein ZapE [Candidatus Pandoraea novymonadis]|uniref:Cell division protein ZapE n=1 Tax=Candidatus Pandoraea novymonadis TaxID=1808959 RepID=A0ABX5FGY7_9BURK|nr:cell division protein ZapE [Candidatus Pandoraea novymonadis]PSB92302.1 Cell division protein ZapE [Candidatus Pandoraea novymonadis]
MDVREYYQQQLLARGYQPDQAQEHAIDRLQYCFDEWSAYKGNHFMNEFMKWLCRLDLPKGVYLWGGVGRGKSFLMDSFYTLVPIQRKIRLHFHEFMREVHGQLQALKGKPDPLDELAKRIAKRYHLICFDEFHVSDVADAMILHQLLAQLFRNRVQFMMTSNYHPNLLYPDGLHRDRVLPAIALIEEKLDILNVDVGIDYRHLTRSQVKIYHSPLGNNANFALRNAFSELAEVSDENPVLNIDQRELKALRCAGGMGWFDFHTLCGGPYSQNDYLELADRFHTIILSDVPKMTAQMASEARRFTWLIDVFYDQKIKLLISAEVPPEQLYIEGVLANEFTRTVSRLIEMQSREYLEMPRRVGDTTLI